MLEWEAELKALRRLEKGDEEQKRQARELYPALLARAERVGAGQRLRLLVRLGRLLLDCGEEAAAQQRFEEAQAAFEALPAAEAAQWRPELLRLLNGLGYLAVNAGEAAAGLRLLERALCLGEELRADGDAARRVEKAFTLTLFFLAQTHAKEGHRDEAAQFCGRTFERQLRAGEPLAPAELTNNALGLAQYYCEEGLLRQASLLLERGRDALGGDCRVERASIDFMLGSVWRRLFEANLALVLERRAEERFLAREEELNRLRLELSGPDTPIVLARSYDALKPVFARAMERYDRARAVFEDGHVTEICEAVKAQCELWAATLPAEPDKARQEAIHLRRQALLEPLLRELNPRAFIKQSAELWAVAAEAATSLFELARERGARARMGRFGHKAIEAWDAVLGYFADHPPEDAQSVQSFVNCNSSKGRIYAHLHEKERIAARENLVRSLACYNAAKEALLAYRCRAQILDAGMEQQLRVTEEYCRLMPAKIQLLDQR